jgi:hypothetical protein
MHKYGKFTDQEITVLNDKNDLVAKVQPKYGSTGPQAQCASMLRERAAASYAYLSSGRPRQLSGAIEGLEVNAYPALICAFLCSPRLDWWSP